jgi:hypothetical protein
VTAQSDIRKQNSKIHFDRLAVAAIIYTGFAVYLYGPYFKNFTKLQHLLVVNVCLGSLGCFVLSRRWVSAFAGSLVAGAVYGFGPFVLGLARFHPTAGFLAASIPWLFCPAAFVGKRRWRSLSMPFAGLPFLAIPLFFRTAAHYRLFAVSTQAKLHLADLPGLLFPLVATSRHLASIGFYHVPLSMLAMGFAMLLAARRVGIIVILCLGTVLACCNSFWEVGPILWLSIPVVCCSVLIGVGFQGLASAGFADRKWVLLVAVMMGALAIVTLLLATQYFQVFAGLADKYAKLLTETAKMYILAAVAVAIIFFIIRARLRLIALRQIVLVAALAVDIFFGARFIVDKIH